MKMKISATALIIITVIIIASCSTAKKTAGTTISSAPAKTTPTPTTTSENPFRYMKSDGIHAPGNEELTAIQVQYKDVTIEKLKEGHQLYTEGACINCHEAKNIYDRPESEWKDIIDNMAVKANISDTQKDAVYKYVLSIKATQPK